MEPGRARERAGSLLFFPLLFSKKKKKKKKHDVEPKPKKTSTPSATSPSGSRTLPSPLFPSPFKCFFYALVRKPGRKTTLEQLLSGRRFFFSSGVVESERLCRRRATSKALFTSLHKEARPRPLPASGAFHPPRGTQQYSSTTHCEVLYEK